MQATGPVVEQPIQDFQLVLDTNCTGPMRMTQAIAPHMIRRVRSPFRPRHSCSFRPLCPSPNPVPASHTLRASNCTKPMRMTQAIFPSDQMRARLHTLHPFSWPEVFQSLTRQQTSHYIILSFHQLGQPGSPAACVRQSKGRLSPSVIVSGLTYVDAVDEPEACQVVK